MTQQGNSSVANAQAQLPLQRPPPPRVAPPVQAMPPANYTGALSAAIDIVSARSLGLLAIVGAVAMFGYATIDPVPWRTYTVIAYAAVVLWPAVYLYIKKE